MSAESVALIVIIAGMAVLAGLAFAAIYVALDGREHADFERRHGEQDTDEIALPRLEDLGGPARPLPPRWDGEG